MTNWLSLTYDGKKRQRHNWQLHRLYLCHKSDTYFPDFYGPNDDLYRLITTYNYQRIGFEELGIYVICYEN